MFLSAGHSNSDPGAISPAIKGAGGRIVIPARTEASIAVELRNIISFYLQRDKVPHMVDGIGLDNMPLNAVVAITRKRNELEVELHCNAGPPTATGVEVLCAPKDNAIAAKLCKVISDTLGIRNRGVKGESSGQHHRLAFVQAGGMIVELFFLSNRNDLRAYDERKWLLGRNMAAVLKEAA